jgi:hypothetical protein
MPGERAASVCKEPAGAGITFFFYRIGTRSGKPIMRGEVRRRLPAEGKKPAKSRDPAERGGAVREPPLPANMHAGCIITAHECCSRFTECAILFLMTGEGIR